MDGDDGEDEVEEHVDDHDVEHVLERVDDAIEHRLTATHQVSDSGPNSTRRTRPDFVGDPTLRQSPRTVRSGPVRVVEFGTNHVSTQFV